MLHVNILEGLAKARHPAARAAAKTATQAPAKQGVTKKRSCNAGKPMCMRTSEGGDASLRKEASILASLHFSGTPELLSQWRKPSAGLRAGLRVF